MYVCVHVNRLFEALPLEKYPVGVMYCLLVEFNCQQVIYCARHFVQEKKFGSILLTGQEMARLTCNCSPDLYNIATGTVCTDSA